MFSKLTPVASIAILAIATSVPGQCDTSSKGMCCGSVASAGSKSVAPILEGLGIVVQDLNVPVGITCSPILWVAKSLSVVEENID
ncbi:hypothetical protein ACEPAF_1882 [Sanghuangporus sanghuang]